MLELLFSRSPRLLAALAALSALAGCSYTSAYVPPPDGRARVVWHDGDVAAHLPHPIDPACGDELLLGMHGGDIVFVPGAPGVVWWWSPVGIQVGGGGPAIPRPGPRFAPGGVHAWGGGGHASSGGGHGSGGGGHSGGGGGGGGGGQAAAVVLVVAIVALPLMTLVLATTRPENEERAAAATDQVNAYNDLARAYDPACLAGAP